MASSARQHLWLLIDYEGKKFDYYVKDRKNPSFSELVYELGEEALRQDVLIPEQWNMFYKNRTSDMTKVSNETGLMHMVEMYPYRDTIEVWIRGTEDPGLYFTVCLELKKRKQEAQEQAQREREERLRKMAQEEEEERLRKEKEEEEERLLRKEQEELQRHVVVEVPVVNVHTREEVYVRIFSAPGYEGTVFTQPPPLHLPNLPLGKAVIPIVLHRMCLWYPPVLVERK